MTLAAGTAIPFGGLGFDLAPIEARARLLVLRRVRLCELYAKPIHGADVPVPSGYDLLVRLSREIRGR